MVRNYRGSSLRLPISLGATALLMLGGNPASAVPSFARQTGMTCSACHTVFPELTPFGREFKINGYVLDNIRQIKGITLQDRENLSLNAFAPLSAMMQISYTHTGAAIPEGTPPASAPGALAKDGDILFPQQFSFFYAGKIADNLGAFVQVTYDGAAGQFGWDNTDIRYARHFSFGGDAKGEHANNLVVGLTLNNNPTVQDPWNSTPAWGFPYSNSSTAPGANAATQIDGSLAGSVAGLGVYAWLNGSFYGEFSLYAPAVIGGAHPLDSTQTNIISGVSPYLRLAYNHLWGSNSVEVGMYGINVREYPGSASGTAEPLSGPINQYKDIAGDFQYQYIGEDNLFTLLGTYIHENQTLNASYAYMAAANPTDSLNTLKLTAEYYYQRMIGGSVGYFNTSGSTDALLYAAAPVTGSASNSPNTRGQIFEINYVPFLNVKLQLQYTHYDRFNGQNYIYQGVPVGYDGSGRQVSGNDTTYLLVWLNY